MDAATIAYSTTAATLIVSLILAGTEYLRRRREAAAARRNIAVGRVLETLERATRSAARSPLTGWWSASELEYALLLPRLSSELAPKDFPVAVWVARRSQLIQSANSRPAQVRIGAEVASQLVRWGHRQIQTDWFKEDLKRDPWQPDFRPPRRARYLREVNDGARLFPAAIIVSVAALVWKNS